MKVCVSNKLEILVGHLAKRLSVPPENPFAAETIVVQSKAMAKWVSLEMAKRHGIAANYRFPFPKNFIEDIFQAFLPDYSKDRSFDESVMLWKIFDLLPQLTGEEFAPLCAYLGRATDPRKRYQLAQKLAWSFDQYLIFRPDMILAWEDGRTGNRRELWQAALWRKMTQAREGMHPARLRDRLFKAMQSSPCKTDSLPERLSIFGISYLPPFYLEILIRLASHFPVDYYYLNPSQEFWGDIASNREIGKVIGRAAALLPDVDDALLHLESGNALLASWGAQGRDFFRRMEISSARYMELFEPPPTESLLGALQSDIYYLQEPQTVNAKRTLVRAFDSSIEVHSCHSPLREIEALHDTLLGAFDADSTLSPHDVVVMTPDIELYAPHIEAVFESREPKIPYTIADRGALAHGGVAGGVMALLNLASSRFTASDVLSILDHAPVSEKFILSAADIDLVYHWVSDLHIKWGIDAEHRLSFDVPAFDQNSWKHGLERLLAGFALDGRRQELFAGILPYPNIEFAEAQVLGRFLSFWDELLQLQNTLRKAHAPETWRDILNHLIETFFSSAQPYRRELLQLQRVVAGFSEDTRNAGLLEPFDLTVMKAWLQGALDRKDAGARFLSGGVSFCALLPMRSIPFAVIALIGMNNNAFPRREPKTGVNLMEDDYRAGDRSMRRDDQYLFLEALLSARKKLILSYVGQSQNDQNDILPSGLVCELMDYLDRNYAVQSDTPVSCMLLRKHPLHAFSPAYFKEGQPLFSYSTQNCLAARAMAAQTEAPSVFADGVLPDTALQDQALTIADLVAFFANPARWFLEERLCLKLTKDQSDEDDTEPFAPDPLDAYAIKQALSENLLCDGDDQRIGPLIKARGVLPVGTAGNYYFSELASNAKAYVKRILPYAQAAVLDSQAIDVRIDNVRLTGVVNDLHEGCRISRRMAKMKTKDYLSAWIYHLVMNAAGDARLPKVSLILAEDVLWRFNPVHNAPEALRILIKYFRLGQTKPLKLFSRASGDYAIRMWLKCDTRENALAAARKAWSDTGGGAMLPESQEPAYKICFGNSAPLDEEFEQTATDIFRPLFEHLEVLE